MDYWHSYDLVRKEIEHLLTFDVRKNYHQCKALAALYELLDYLANIIAENGPENEMEHASEFPDADEIL